MLFFQKKVKLNIKKLIYILIFKINSKKYWDKKKTTELIFNNFHFKIKNALESKFKGIIANAIQKADYFI